MTGHRTGLNCIVCLISYISAIYKFSRCLPERDALKRGSEKVPSMDILIKEKDDIIQQVTCCALSSVCFMLLVSRCDVPMKTRIVP